MSEFGRITRQDTIWTELNDIRAEIDEGLRSPEESSYEEYEGGPELADLQGDWEDLVEEYEDIHADNDTKG